MARNTIAPLSKTRYMAGLQCSKRLYLESYHPHLAPPVGPSKQALFDSGHAVGHLATKRFPGGKLIEEGHKEHSLAMAKTRVLLSDAATKSIYEAAFTFDAIRIRIDILKRGTSGQFHIIEVKSSTRVKPEHIQDIAVQVYVAEGSGLKIDNVYLMHINRAYVYRGGDYELDKLFRIEDITTSVRDYLSGPFTNHLARMRETLAEEDTPAVRVGRHCTKPYECPFYSHCRTDAPEHHIEQLPGAKDELLEALDAAGIDDIRHIPVGFQGMGPLQIRAQECVATGFPYLGPNLGSMLSEVQPPFLFLDFETFNPGLPIYNGTRPYQVIPFQWSMHIQSANGDLDHKSFLHVGLDDPRPCFIDALVNAAGSTGTVLVYSGYELTQIKRLIIDFPEHEKSLRRISERMFDLLKAIRSNYYHPQFHGSYSIKSVLRAFSPDDGYDDLTIQNGGDASVAYAQMISPAASKDSQEETRRNLLRYCERDTSAMVRVFQSLNHPPPLQTRLF